MRPQFLQPRPHAVGISRQIKRPQRTHLAKADNAGVGLDADDGAVEDGNGFAAGPFVAAFVQGKFDAMGEDAGDFHGWGV